MDNAYTNIYIKLFNVISDVILALQAVQAEAEEIFAAQESAFAFWLPQPILKARTARFRAAKRRP
jgi:hypothetical protein